MSNLRRSRVAHGIAVSLFLVTLVSGGLRAQVRDRGALIKAIDSLAEETLQKGPNAGLAVGVAVAGEVMLAKGYGYADLEHRVPVTAETVFRLGSITKQFTGVAVMQLVEQGKVKLDDPLHKYFPDYPAHARDVTVEDLIDHTSGIRNYTALSSKYWLEEFRHDLTNAELIDLFDDEPLDFAPRRGYNYSNSAFFLAGVIVEKVTGQTYAEYLAGHVFGPLGMYSSSYCDQRAIVPHRASGYDVADGALINTSFISMKVPGPAGAACSTVLDLITWHRALADNRILSEEAFRRMTGPAKLANGVEVHYGGGLSTADVDGHRKIGHGGQVNGFQALSYHYPDDDVTVVVLANTNVENNAYNPAGLEERIARLVLGLAPPPTTPLAVSEQDLRRYEGTYTVGRDRTRIALENGHLMMYQGGGPAVPLVPRGGDVFEIGPLFPMRLQFNVEDGIGERFLFSQAGIAIAVAGRSEDASGTSR